MKKSGTLAKDVQPWTLRTTNIQRAINVIPEQKQVWGFKSIELVQVYITTDQIAVFAKHVQIAVLHLMLPITFTWNHKMSQSKTKVTTKNKSKK